MLLDRCVKNVQIRSLFWSVFSRICTEYGEIQSISPYSARMRENTDQKKLRICTLFTQWIFSNDKKQCMFAKITTCEIWKSSSGIFVFLLKTLPKTAVLIQLTTIYSYFLRVLWMEPYISVSQTLRNRENEPPPYLTSTIPR